MPIEVVYNEQYGGFSLSPKATKIMADLGNREAQEEMARPLSEWESERDRYLYLDRTPRHDPILVRTVRELGKEANGQSASLRIKVLKGDRYIIKEYDGAEDVVEPEDIKWIQVKV